METKRLIPEDGEEMEKRRSGWNMGLGITGYFSTLHYHAVDNDDTAI